MKLKAMVFASRQEWNEKEPWRFTMFGADMSEYGYTKVADIEVEFDAPPEEVLREGTIKAYRAEQQRLRAEMQLKLNAIEESIQKLLAIEDKSQLKAVA